jgi:S-formylglutathione hydrolase FrmB
MTVRHRVMAALAAALIAVAAVVAASTSATVVHLRGARVIHMTITSRYVHARMPLTLVIPAGARPHPPLLIFLHGRGGDQNSELSNQFFAALHGLGSAAPDVAFPYGGDHSYWHNRAGAAWGSYVLREVLPTALRVTKADGRRVAIGGISMGGFGAYDLARLDPNRFCAVGGHSAAIWPAAADTAPGAFDDAADFDANNVIADAQQNPDLYGRSRLWLDGGSDDPFHAADEELAAALHIHMHVWPGGHDSGYWNAHWGRYLEFYAGAFRACAG